MLGCNVNKQSRSHRSIASSKKKSRSAASVENEVYSLPFVEGEMRNLTEKRLFQSLLLIESATLFKKKLQQRCFPVNFAKLRTGF